MAKYLKGWHSDGHTDITVVKRTVKTATKEETYPA